MKLQRQREDERWFKGVSTRFGEQQCESDRERDRDRDRDRQYINIDRRTNRWTGRFRDRQ